MATSISVCPFFKTLPNSSIVFCSLHVAWVGLVSPSQLWTLVIPWWFMMLSNIWQLSLSWHRWRSWKHQERHSSFCWTEHHIILTYKQSPFNIWNTVGPQFLQRKQKWFAMCCSHLLDSILLPAGSIIPSNATWVFPAFLDDSHHPKQKQHCSSRWISGGCEKMCKTKCTHAEGRKMVTLEPGLA